MAETVGEYLDRLVSSAENKLSDATDDDRDALHSSIAVFQAVRRRVDTSKVLKSADFSELQSVSLSMGDDGNDISAAIDQLADLIDGF
jgi:ABC-type transporter Mla subunit MlaD